MTYDGIDSSAEFADPEALARREADHLHLDTVLQSRVGAEDAELGAVSTVTIFDRLIRPARYAAALAELERRCAARVRELTAPGPVLLTFARRGFGVLP